MGNAADDERRCAHNTKLKHRDDRLAAGFRPGNPLAGHARPDRFLYERVDAELTGVARDPIGALRMLRWADGRR